MGTSEKINSQTTQSKENEGPETGGQTMSPPAFQLKADPVQRKEGGDGEMDAGGVPAELMEHLKLREGWRTKVYLDSRGLPTVGLGHLLSTAEKAQYPVGASVPLNLLNTWATNDAQKAWGAAQSQAATLGVSSKAFAVALASVNFQLGTGWNTKFKKTWSYMTQGQWEKAALECQDSAWYAQTPVRVQDFQAALRALAGTAPAKTPSADPAKSPASTPAEGFNFKIGAPTGSGTSTGDGVNVRKGPGTNFEKTGKKLSKGSSVTIYGEAQGWYCIGQGEWVTKDFISTGKQTAAPGKESKPAAKPAGPNVKEIASAVWEAMFGGYTGFGTDEEGVYRNLAKLNHDGALITSFKAAYKALHGGDVVADIKSEFSNSIIYGNQLDKALGYLNATSPKTPASPGNTPEKKPSTTPAQKPKTNAPAAGKNPNWDIEKAVATLNANASAKSLGKCAKYVRMAINAGGVATPGNPVSAKDYKGYLEKFGFKQVAKSGFQKGDIAVFEAFQGDNKYHEHGHIQMFNGTQWVSDFVQRDYWAGGDYRKHQPGNVVYRM